MKTLDAHRREAARLVNAMDQVSGAEKALVWLVAQMHLAVSRGEYLSEAALGGWRYARELDQ